MRLGLSIRPIWDEQAERPRVNVSRCLKSEPGDGRDREASQPLSTRRERQLRRRPGHTRWPSTRPSSAGPAQPDDLLPACPHAGRTAGIFSISDSWTVSPYRCTSAMKAMTSPGRRRTVTEKVEVHGRHPLAAALEQRMHAGPRCQEPFVGENARGVTAQHPKYWTPTRTLVGPADLARESNGPAEMSRKAHCHRRPAALLFLLPSSASAGRVSGGVSPRSTISATAGCPSLGAAVALSPSSQRVGEEVGWRGSLQER
jgi:hypothetical protein